MSTSRYSVDRAGALGALNIDGDTLAFQPVIGEDALRALGRLPGIAQNGVSAQSNIRGGEAGELLTLLDGFPLRQSFHNPAYQSVFGVIDPGLVGDAVVYTGGFPVRYGNRMGGVFDLSTVDVDHAPQSALGLSVFNAMGRNAGRLDSGNLDWLGAVRIGTLRPLVELASKDSARPSYSDVYARIGHGEPDRLRLTANVLWSRDELGIDREGYGESAQMESRNRYLWLRADRDFGTNVEAALWLGHSTIDSFRKGSVDREDIAVGAVERPPLLRIPRAARPRHLAAGRASLAGRRLRVDGRERRLPLRRERRLHASRRGTVRARSDAPARDHAEAGTRACRALCRLPLADSSTR